MQEVLILDSVNILIKRSMMSALLLITSLCKAAMSTLTQCFIVVVRDDIGLGAVLCRAVNVFFYNLLPYHLLSSYVLHSVSTLFRLQNVEKHVMIGFSYGVEVSWLTPKVTKAHQTYVLQCRQHSFIHVCTK